MKISHCGPLLHLVMCVNSADCVGDSASMGNAGHSSHSVFGPLEMQRLLERCMWLSLDVAVP